jgi:Flp pilus assembly protein TadG
MTMANGRGRTGSSVVEFSLVGIPIIFVILSTFEMSRGMWIYHSLAYAAKEGTRYAAVHGETCSPPDNNCLRTVGQVATRIRNASIGLDPTQMNVTFTPAVGGTSTRKLSAWMQQTATWPPTGSNSPGQDVQITMTYPFRSLICMVWPGAGTQSLLGTYLMPASARERIQF